MAHETGEACGAPKHSRRVYEGGATEAGGTGRKALLQPGGGRVRHLREPDLEAAQTLSRQASANAPLWAALTSPAPLVTAQAWRPFVGSTGCAVPPGRPPRGQRWRYHRRDRLRPHRPVPVPYLLGARYVASWTAVVGAKRIR